MLLNTFELSPRAQHLHGASLAQSHLAPLMPDMCRPTAEPAIFILDLGQAASVTASYIRATLHWVLLCGQAEVQQKGVGGGIDIWAIRPLPLYPIVTGCSPEIAGEVDDFFRSRNLPLLHVTERTKRELKSAHLLGTLDSFLATSLQGLTKLGEGTAMQLSKASNEAISVNGWNNRLADLYHLRLVTRRRSGKFWIYSPLVRTIKLWA